jgi:hypothetical protein
MNLKSTNHHIKSARLRSPEPDTSCGEARRSAFGAKAAEI